ncbi:MAG: hypothetical protein HYR60_11075 [Acidobacteria bacterium]|nr:hypothetical protein [Acidobacteriota bacterium]
MKLEHRKRGERGNVLVEFALSAWLLLIPLFLGMVWGGVSMGRGIQITQITRDAGHMYAKNVDFTQTTNKDIITRLALGTNMTNNGGDGVIILSQIIKVYDADCTAASIPLGSCTNNGKTVFIHRVTIGDVNDQNSHFGTPTPVNADGSVPNYLTNTNAVASNFTPLLDLKQGEVAYLAEGYLVSPDISFATQQTGIYSYSVF